MRKIYNPYKDASIFELNMLNVHEFRKIQYSGVETLVMIMPVLAIMMVLCSSFLPELTFIADCRNIANGDVCSITLG